MATNTGANAVASPSSALSTSTERSTVVGWNDAVIPVTTCGRNNAPYCVLLRP
jgi:hypothetical protein